MPVLAPITKRSTTVTDVDHIATVVDELARAALTPHRGPVFCDFPLDVVFRHGEADVPDATRIRPSLVDHAKRPRDQRLITERLSASFSPSR